LPQQPDIVVLIMWLLPGGGYLSGF